MFQITVYAHRRPKIVSGVLVYYSALAGLVVNYLLLRHQRGDVNRLSAVVARTLGHRLPLGYALHWLGFAQCGGFLLLQILIILVARKVLLRQRIAVVALAAGQRIALGIVIVLARPADNRIVLTLALALVLLYLFQAILKQINATLVDVVELLGLGRCGVPVIDGVVDATIYLLLLLL